MTLTGKKVKPPVNFEEYFEEVGGKLFWKVFINAFAYPGKEVTRRDNKGYYRVGLGRKNYLVHRVVYYLYTKEWPDIVDHIDGDITNNSICNLRGASPWLNSVNRGLQRNNTSGVKGVCFHKQSGKYLARFATEEKRINLGLFDTIEEGKVAIEAARLLVQRKEDTR